MDGFRANMFIQNNIIGFEQISINITKKIALMASCKVFISISIRQRLQLIIKKLLNMVIIILPLSTKTFVLVHLFILLNN